MNNNDIFKKLRVALQLRDDQIVAILELVNFRISKGELGNFFRNDDHPKYMECGDQILRNFLNGLVIHLRGTKENPKTPLEVIKNHKKQDTQAPTVQKTLIPKAKSSNPKFKPTKNSNARKESTKVVVVEKVRFKNGKPKKE